MDRQYYTFVSPLARSNCLKALSEAPDGTRVQINGPKRSHIQNSKLWAMLTDVSNQLEHGGRHYDPASWKSIFLHAFGRETKFLPALDGKSFVPIPQSSSDLSVKEMSDFIEFIYSEGLQRGVAFSDSEPKAEHRGRAA